MKKLEAIKSDKIWGYELWIASTHPNGTQKEFMELCTKEYPLLVKIIQANEALSIQVHPDDEMAVKLEGEGTVGKTECWYVLSAEPGAKLVYGLSGDYPKEELAKAITNNDLERYLNYVEVHQGDFIFIPSGTVHAIGGGLRLMEVQQSCDLTYRLYDYDRVDKYGNKRHLDIEKAMDVMRWHILLAVIKNEKIQKVALFQKNFECQYFSLEKVDVKGGWSMFCSNDEKPQGVQLLYVLSSNKAVIKNQNTMPVTICEEEIYAVEPGEKITIEGTAQIMRIRCK